MEQANDTEFFLEFSIQVASLDRRDFSTTVLLSAVLNGTKIKELTLNCYL